MHPTSFKNCQWWFAIVICLFVAGAHAQVIKGNVQDAKTLEPLPFANVFINNTTIGTVTDLKGNFILQTIRQPGTYELVVSFVGYESFKSDITIASDETISADVKLVPAELELNNIEVRGTRDLLWEKNLKRFEKVFLGKDKLAESCKILNPWVIDFEDDPILKKFTAKAADPIEIYNISLGYKVMFYLNVFWSDKTSYFISGNVRFEEMQGFNEQEQKTWEINRRNSYLHSNHHLFKAMVENRVRGEGFRLYSEKPEFENVTVRSANFGNDLGRYIVPLDTAHTVFTTDQTGYYKIKFKGRVEVHYVNERPSVRTYRDIPYMVSWIRLNKDSVVVNRDGFELNPADVVISGDMSTDRVARMLPANYQPGKSTSIKPVEVSETVLSLFQEKVYVSTDKPYYYPGEPMWLKGYVNYRSPGLRDSMSRTAYVEIIHPKKKIILSKTLQIDSGFFHGDFILPDTLSEGTYYMRSYTNFSRNFGDENLFVQPIPVVTIREKVKPKSGVGQVVRDSLLTVLSDKQKYKLREKITLKLSVKDDEGQPLASNLSMSVTDATQVVPLEVASNIKKDYPVGEIKKEIAKKDFKYAIEYGITFPGQFVNAKNKPEEATLNVVQLEPRNFTMTHSDPTGLFIVTGVTFYDTAQFSIQSVNKKGEPYGKAKLLKRDLPALNFTFSPFKVEIIKTETPQRIFSEYEVPKDSKLLEEIEVRATRIVGEDVDYRVKRPYGKPDFVLTSKDLTLGYGNLLYTLPGKIPGLIVREVLNNEEGPRWVVYLQRSVSMEFPPEVLVTVNNAIVGGTPASILGAIDPNNVETVELKKGVNVLYGFYGGSGILAIYTKDGSNIVKDSGHLSTIKVPGYARPRRFKFPDYSDPSTDFPADYRSLVYWNPNVITHEATGESSVSFYATDLPGKYRVLVEGVAQNGKPVRSVSYIEVD